MIYLRPVESPGFETRGVRKPVQDYQVASRAIRMRSVHCWLVHSKSPDPRGLQSIRIPAENIWSDAWWKAMYLAHNQSCVAIGTSCIRQCFLPRRSGPISARIGSRSERSTVRHSTIEMIAMIAIVEMEQSPPIDRYCC